MPDIIDQIIHKLPGEAEAEKQDAIRVMTVRMPASLHEALKDEARIRKTSANKLAVAKLAIKGEILDLVAATIPPVQPQT